MQFFDVTNVYSLPWNTCFGGISWNWLCQVQVSYFYKFCLCRITFYIYSLQCYGYGKMWHCNRNGMALSDAIFGKQMIWFGIILNHIRLFFHLYYYDVFFSTKQTFLFFLFASSSSHEFKLVICNKFSYFVQWKLTDSSSVSGKWFIWLLMACGRYLSFSNQHLEMIFVA